MNVAENYERQRGWRSWNQIFEKLPVAPGQVILDLGCGIGDEARELAAHGANVIGIDTSQERIQVAKARSITKCDFRCGDLRNVPKQDLSVHGIWCSFTAAYFTDFPVVLKGWRQCLAPLGWVAIIEIDDLFGHEPLSARTKELLNAYAVDAMRAGRYDFRMGAKLQNYLRQSDYDVLHAMTLPDQELSFDGSAPSGVINSWRSRFERMKLLQEFCGSEFNRVRDEVLACLTRPDHFSTARVVACIARKSSALLSTRG